MQRFCDDAAIEYSRADFYLRHRGDQILFCRGPIDGNAEQIQQVELYVLRMMIETIRLALGADWYPEAVNLQLRDKCGVRDHPVFRYAQPRFGQSATEIIIDQRLCMARIGHPGGERTHGLASSSASDVAATTLTGSLRELLSNCLGPRMPGLSTAAEISQRSARTLQRQLQAEGQSYSTVVDQARFQVAVKHLEDPAIRITDIAFEVGYSDPAHFTRAFRRWAGVSPSTYRRSSLSLR